VLYSYKRHVKQIELTFILDFYEKYKTRNRNIKQNDCSQRQLNDIQHKINNRPREKLNFQTPNIFFII
jgi:IS30 family transposase